MKPNLSKLHLRHSARPHYKMKLSCGVLCSTVVTVASVLFEHNLAAVIGMVLNAGTAIFWIWE